MTAMERGAMSEHPDDSEHGRDGADRYLTFRLGGEEYGVEILRVQSIQVWEDATPIPNSPPWMLGVTNLRGAIVPIVDLRRRFDLADWSFGPTTVVIVVRIGADADEGERVIGMVVDGVSEVRALHPDAVQPAPEFAGSLDVRFVRGLTSVDDRMLILLDVDQLLRDSLQIDLDADAAA